MTTTISRYSTRVGDRIVATCDNCGGLLIDADLALCGPDIEERIADSIDHTCPDRSAELRNPTGMVVTFDPAAAVPHTPGEKGSRIVWKGCEYMPTTEAQENHQ